jgi:hypothetical protein
LIVSLSRIAANSSKAMEAEMKQEGVQEHVRTMAANSAEPIIDRSPSIRGLLTTFENSTGPLSIRLNAAYGTGKTFFLDQLSKTADQEKFIVIYYNAWEEEISFDARSSLCLKLLNEIQKLNKEDNFQSAIFKYQKAILPFITSAGTAIISRVVFRDHEALENIINAIKPETEIRKLIDDKFAELQKNSFTIDTVKNSLKGLLELLSEKKVILLIDELDRCRPDFAIEVLETVKHFFSIERVFALVGVDENVLHSIIKKRYGDSIDCEGYLLRHFSSEIYLSDFSYEIYCQSKCREFGINSDFHKNVVFICSGYRLSLRQMNNYISNLAAIFKSEHKSKAKDFGRYILVLGIKLFDKKLFNECINQTREDYFQERIRNLRLLNDDSTGPFEELVFLIQKSRSDYTTLCESFNCQSYSDFNRYYSGNGKPGFEQYANTISKFEDFSVISE